MGNLFMSGQHTARFIPCPKAPLRWRLRNWLRWGFVWGLVTTLLARGLSKLTGIPTLIGELSCKLVSPDGKVVDYGVVSRRVITTAFVNFMVDQLQAETSEWGDFKFHDSGVGTTAAAIGDTDIETTDGESRVAGTQTENADNIYETVATIAYTSTLSITEHMVFSQITGGTGLDRSVFASIGVVNGSSIEHTYRLTVPAGG